MQSTAPLVTEYGKALTPKEELFINEYIANGGNATQACIVAGYKTNSPYTKNFRFPGKEKDE